MYADERHAANLLPWLALETPSTICAHSVAALLGLKPASGSHVLPVLKGRGWIAFHSRITHGNPYRPHDAYRVGSNLNDAVELVHANLLEGLTEANAKLYNRTVDARKKVPYRHELDPAYQASSVLYLGGVALLNETIDLKEYGNWLGGREGWSALITIRAHHDPDAYSRAELEGKVISLR